MQLLCSCIHVRKLMGWREVRFSVFAQRQHIAFGGEAGVWPGLRRDVPVQVSDDIRGKQRLQATGEHVALPLCRGDCAHVCEQRICGTELVQQKRGDTRPIKSGRVFPALFFGQDCAAIFALEQLFIGFIQRVVPRPLLSGVCRVRVAIRGLGGKVLFGKELRIQGDAITPAGLHRCSIHIKVPPCAWSQAHCCCFGLSEFSHNCRNGSCMDREYIVIAYPCNPAIFECLADPGVNFRRVPHV